jgi:energy-coupling factor transport system ATP-binding protein
MSTTPVIAIEHLHFTYHNQSKPALHDISLTIPAGQCVAITGPAGAGKSTLCTLLAGFMPHFFKGEASGQVTVNGVSPLQSPVIDMLAHVTIVLSQANTQISGVCFTVADEVGFGLQNLGVPADVIRQRVAEALTLMEIAHLAERSPFQLSGGQQQRVVIAAALAQRPPILILDEPTAQLDPPAVAQLGATLRRLVRNGQTIIVAEHQLDWVAEFADRVCVLDHGRLVADGPPHDILRMPGTPAGRPYALRVAQHLAKHGMWQPHHPLAITVDELVTGIVPAPASPPHTRPLVPLTDTVGAPLLAIEQVSFTYPSGVAVLHGVSLTIRAGERVALLGKNGAGKSTLLRHFNGLLRPSSGHVRHHGHDIVKQAPGRASRCASIVFQDVRNQLFAATIADEVAFGLKLLKLDQATIERRVAETLAICGIATWADSHPYDIPVALRRLVATAAVMALESDMLALDEPTAGMDEAAIAYLAQAIHHVHDQGRSVVVVSHDLNFCAAYTDRVVLLKDGLIVLDAHWSELSNHQLQQLADEVGLPLGHACCAQLALPTTSPSGTILCDAVALR